MTDGKVALVTGATRGIGRAVVDVLLARGRRVVACGRDEALLRQLQAADSERVRTLRADLTEAGEAVRVVDDAVQLFGHVHELVCAAGVVQYAPVGQVTAAELRAQLEVNFIAPFLMAQHAALHMGAHDGGGSIVFVASTLGLRSAAGTVAYGASKAALLQGMRGLASELAPAVRVNAVAPGVVDTAMVRVLRGPAVDDPFARAQAVDAQLRGLAALHPLGRLGTPVEIAEAILFLLDASWITGSTLRIDGGLLAR